MDNINKLLKKQNKQHSEDIMIGKEKIFINIKKTITHLKQTQQYKNQLNDKQQQQQDNYTKFITTTLENSLNNLTDEETTNLLLNDTNYFTQDDEELSRCYNLELAVKSVAEITDNLIDYEREENDNFKELTTNDKKVFLTNSYKDEFDDNNYIKNDSDLERDDKSIDLTTLNDSITDDIAQKAHYIKYLNRDGKVVKVWECGICGRDFQHQYTLMRHLPTHTNVRNFICNECGKAFRQLSTLSQHRAIHSVERPYSCESCNKSFNRISTLISHRKTHSNVKPFQCHMCQKGFHQKGNLRNHIYIHTNERPYRCPFCNKGFNQMSNLVCHKQKSHSAEAASVWTCHRCEENFPKRSLLRAHELETHQVQEAIKKTNKKTNNLNVYKVKTKALESSNSSSANSVVSLKQPDKTGEMKLMISDKGILIPPIKTDAMKTTKAKNEVPFAVLHLLRGEPLIVRIIDYNGKSLLRAANTKDFEAIKLQQKVMGEKISVAIVAAIYQCDNPNGETFFNIMPPKNIYKVSTNQQQMMSLSVVDGEISEPITPLPVGKVNNTHYSNNVCKKSKIPDDLNYLLGTDAPPVFSSDMKDYSSYDIGACTLESITGIKIEPNYDDDIINYDPSTCKTTVGNPRAIAIVDEQEWWKQKKSKKRVTCELIETEDISETFKNIATSSLLTPKRVRKMNSCDSTDDEDITAINLNELTPKTEDSANSIDRDSIINLIDALKNEGIYSDKDTMKNFFMNHGINNDLDFDMLDQ